MNETFDLLKGLLLRIIIGIGIFIVVDYFWIVILNSLEAGAGSSEQAHFLALASFFSFLVGYRYIPKGKTRKYIKGKYPPHLLHIESQLRTLKDGVIKDVKGQDYWIDRIETHKKYYKEGKISTNDFYEKLKRYKQWLESNQAN